MPDAAGGNDRFAHLTDAQRRAIHTVDRSVLVSAAAGSGKTTVLAERCAVLVCDLPGDRRCRINELLVVTFTDAAASEMRSRIAGAIRQRLHDQPGNAYLREQLYLLDSASISTIHAFCKTLIQRWFPQAQVDPQATVLGGDEAELLRREVLDALFVELYAGEDDLSRSFQQLVDDYGGGDDQTMAEVVLQLHGFINSLPAPQAWLDNAAGQLDPAAPAGLVTTLHGRQCDRLRRELSLQMEYCRHLAATVRKRWPIAASHADALKEHVGQLERWHDALAAGADDCWEVVAQEIRSSDLPPAKRRPRGLSDEEKAQYEAAKSLRDRMKKLFAERLQESICTFTADEYREGLARIAPSVRALVQLVTGFDRRYQEAKAAQAAVDFNDLQRCALRLLTEAGDPSRPSEVARQLQGRYRYLLVDEFQDVDPLQEAILRLVSRESADPPSGNLFAVGDIKQSIYRFRLAEPRLFTRRADEFAAGAAIGELIHLQDNFRSRASVIEAVNLIFEPLMRKSFGGSDYDAAARLYAGARFPAAPDAANAATATGPGKARVFDKPAVELHLLEPITERTRPAQDDDEDGNHAAEDELEGIEREAYVIGRRIQQWMGDNREGSRWHVTDKADTPGGLPKARPIDYRDVVILLRSMPYKAGPIADVLRRMGIPVRVERDDSGIDSTEFRDVVSLLELLDNQQQDIPLAAVLRSPLLGEGFTETELLRIRLLDRGIPFHAAARRYVREGLDEGLRDRLTVVMATLDRYRQRIWRTPVAEVLWNIYEESNYLAYVAGLSDGARRREHLIRLHELARQFGRFNRQGLRRFLRFIDQMLAHDRPLQQPSTTGAGDNVVRVMTVHTSKGLEFPVVILADLGKQFNLNDLRGNVLVDRELGIAMRVADPERRITYPTFIHQVAADAGRRELLSEELRVLYVALTRAREHLMLVGRFDPAKAATCRAAGRRTGSEPVVVPRLELETASHPLDWLLPAISRAPDGVVQWHGEEAGDGPAGGGLFKVYAHDRTTTDRWRIPAAIETERTEALARLADLNPLPREEWVAQTDEADRIVEALEEDYPALELTTLPARVAVSELKRRWDAGFDPDERPAAPRRRAVAPARPAFMAVELADDGMHRGIATHRFLQLVDLTRPCDAADLERQCREFVESGRLGPGDAAVVMLDAAAWFFATGPGQQMRRHAPDVRREVAFVSRIPPEHYDPLVAARDHRDVLLVRGIVDALVCHEASLELVDYKTDAIAADACEARAADYQTQIDSYAAAIRGIYRQPVTKQYLVFLHARRIVDIAAWSA